MNDQDIINFLKSMDPGAPIALRDFDKDPRFAHKYPSAQEIWRTNEVLLGNAVDLDIDVAFEDRQEPEQLDLIEESEF